MGDLVLAEGADAGLVQGLARARDDPGADDLAEFLVGQAEDLDLGDAGMGEEKLLDLARIDVLAAAQDHVLDAPGDAREALGVDHGQIARVHPAVDQDGVGPFAVVPVALHHRIAAGQQFALLSHGQDPAVPIHHLAFHVRMDAAHRADALFDRVIDVGLKGHGRGFGHAIGDGHVRHVHPRLDLLHHLHRAGCARHDAGAQARQVEAGEVGMVKLGHEHRGHAIERRAPLAADRAQRVAGIEAFARDDHGRALGDAAQGAHDHAEAMVEGHRDAEAVPFGQPHRGGDVRGIVDDVAMGQAGPFRAARGARGELDVDRVGVGQGPHDPVEIAGGDRVAPAAQVVEAQHARRHFGADGDDPAQVGHGGGGQLPRFRPGQFRADLGQHGEIVRCLEARRGDEGAAFHVPQRIAQFVGTIGGVDADEDRADPGRRELGQQPFAAVRRPDAHPVATLHADRQQAARDAVDLGREVAIAPPQAFGQEHRRVAVGPARDRVGQKVRDRAFQQRHVGRAADMGHAVDGHSVRHVQASFLDRCARFMSALPSDATLHPE